MLLQEDAHLAALDFDTNSSLFGVFDGHGGSEVAKFAAIYLVYATNLQASMPESLTHPYAFSAMLQSLWTCPGSEMHLSNHQVERAFPPQCRSSLHALLTPSLAFDTFVGTTLNFGTCM